MHATSPHHNISTFVATDKGGVSHTVANKASSVLPRSEEMENGFPEGRLTIDLSVSSSPVPHSANNGHQRSVGQYSLLDNHQNIVDLNILQQQLIAVQQQQQAARLQTGALPTIVNNPHAYNNANFISNHPQPASNSCLSPHQQLAQQLFARALAQQYSYLANVPTQQLYFSLNNLMSSVDVCNNVAMLPQQQQPLCGLVQQNASTPRPSQQTNINGPLIHSECSNSAGNSRGTPNSSMTSPNGGGGGRPTSATVFSPEVLEQHINRLISENDAMLESSPMLTKRRSYTSRQHHGGSLDYSTMTGGHQQQQNRSLTNGRGCRSQSLIETSSPPCLLPQNVLTNSFLASASSSNVPISEIAAAVPSTSSSVNQALNFHAQVESATLEAMDKLYNCTYCHLAIRHLDELKRHEEKCARRDEFCTNVATKFFSRDEQSGSKCGGSVLITDANLSVISENKRSAVASPIIENKHPLKKRILAAEFAQKPPKDEATFRPVVAPLSAASNSLSFSANKIVAQPDHVAKVTCALTSVSQSFVDAGPKFIASDAYLQVIPKVSLSTSERLGILRPYCVTVEIRDQNPLEPTKSGRKPHQVTQTTNSASLRRITPSVDWQSTEYAHWPQIIASPLESKLNIMLMDGFVTKCRPPYLHYTVADKDLNLMHATHSSNWSYSKTRFPYVATTSSPSTKTSVDAAVPKLSPTASSMLVLQPEAISSSEKSNCDAVSSIESDDDVLPKTGNKHAIAVVPTARSCQPIVSTFKDDGSTILEESTYSSTNVATVSNFENPDSCKTNTVAVAVCTTSASSSSLSRELLKNILTSNSHHQSVKKVTVCNGGYKTNEAYTYVRGRGRGRYVCARCGIRCKKPSMLKKHIRTHLNVRPYSCAQCMFSFKTKGNLTKHLKSKSHSKKCASLQSNDDDGTDSKNGLNASMDMLDDDTDETLTDDDPENMSDDEMETIAQQIWQHGSNPTNELRQRACSFKNVWNRVRTGMYFDRQVRTPPLDAFSTISDDFSCDRCDSAPPCLTLDTLSTDILPPEHQIPLSSASTMAAPSVITSVYSEAKNALFYNNCEASSNSSLLQHQKLVATSSTMDSGVQNFTPTTNNNYLNCLLTPEGKTKCEICGEEFLKFGLLKLHMYTHVVEQSNRRQSDKCPYCNSSFRSKNVLQKHLLHAHPQQSQHYANSNAATPSSSSSTVLQSASEISSKVGQPADDRGVAAQRSALLSANVSPNLMTSSSSSGTNNKPRPFECRDCDKSFRIHGHLAKHLRSKSHIMQLECLEKVPIGTFAKLEESNCDYFTDIDTSDSENSLKSLLKLAQKLMTSSPSTTPTKEHIRVDNLTVDTTVCQSSNRSLSVTASVNHLSPAIVANNNGSTVVSSLTCTEELRPSPSPSPKKHFVDNKTSTLGGARTVVADVWIPPKETVISANGVPELRQASVNNHVINATFAKPLYVRQQDATSLPPSCVSAKQTSDAASTANVDVVSDVKPLKSETFCNFCSIDFPSVIELEIHWHADHIFMRDGNNFKCPKANCDTVYPSKRDLRNHLSSHYYGTFDSSVDSASTPTGSSCSSGDVSKATVVALSRKINNSVASVGANCNNPPSNSNASSCVQDSPSPSDAYSRRVLFEKTKTHVVKLKFGNTSACNETSGPSADSSPISDSDASRASVGSQSLSPAQQNFASSDRHLLKRHSSEDFVSFVPSKRLITEDMAQRSYANAKEASDFMLRNTTPSGVTSFSQQQQQTSFACTTPSPLAIPVPVVAQRPPAPLWTSFVNNCVGGQSSPQAMYLTAAAAAAALPVQNSAAAFLGLTHPAAFLAAVQQNAKFFNAAAWPTPFALNNSSLNHNGGGVQQVFNQPLIGQQVCVSGGGGSSNPGHHHEFLSSPNAFFLDQLRCIYCQKQCHSLVSLQEHLMSHAQPRSHVCKFCDAAFTTAQALQAHTPCRMQKSLLISSA